jgi:hypothetical protein
MATTNFLSPIEFKFILSRLPNVEFFVQGANVPGMTSGVTDFPTPFKILHEPGDKLSYDDLNITVICDENLTSYIEVQDWLVGLTRPESFDQYKELVPRGIKSDASLIILNSNKNANVVLKFKDVFPIAISAIQLSTTGTDVTPPTFDITFKHSGYKIEVK